jgi:hypothetical protein
VRYTPVANPRRAGETASAKLANGRPLANELRTPTATMTAMKAPGLRAN